MSSGNSEEDSILPVVPSDEALEEANNYIKEAFDILKRETIKVRKEKEAFDWVAKKIEHVHFSKMVMLNVGGHFFSTSLATLNKDPGMFRFQIIWFLTVTCIKMLLFQPFPGSCVLHSVYVDVDVTPSKGT